MRRVVRLGSSGLGIARLAAGNPTEAEIQKGILGTLRVHRLVADVWRNNVGMRGRIRYGVPGQGDLLGYLKTGIFFSIECKRPIGAKPPTDEQKAWIDKCRSGNCLAGAVSAIEGAIAIIEGRRDHESIVY